jgi:exopolysaccharide biosynthesis polyprenyl glycosylphosphotransferase
MQDGRNLKTAGSMTGGRASVEVVPPITEPKARPSTFAPSVLKQRLIAADIAVVAISIVLAFVWQWLVQPERRLGVQRSHLTLAFITFPAWIVSFSLHKLYQARAVERPTEELRRIIYASLAAVGVMVAVSFVFQFKALSRLWVLSLLTFVIVLMAIERLVARRIFVKMRRTGLICRPVLIVGTDADAVALLHAAQRTPHLGYRVVGFVGADDIGTRGGCQVLGPIDRTGDVLQATGATGVLISLSSVDPEVVNKLTRELTDGGYHVALSSGLHDIDVVRFRAQDLGGRTLIYVEQIQRGGWRAIAKRSFDIAVSVLALVVTAPITAAAAIAVKRSSPGDVIFKQERVGRDGETFRVFKFRTMVQDAEARRAELEAHNEADGPMFKIAEDPRVTKVGRLLRRLSIDEIPQFVNVLRGDMSVVGPRPALPSEVEQWTEDVHDRLRVLPGITGMWQVSGRSDTTFDEYKRLDLYYVDNWSLAHDARIVCKTFAAVVKSRGAR